MADVVLASHVTAASIHELANENRFQLLVDVIEDYSIYLLDPSGVVMSWNRGAERNKGYAAAEIVGKSFELFFDAASRAEGAPRRLLDEASAKGRAEDEGWRLRRDGERFWAVATIFAIRNGEGFLLGFAKVTRDCTLQLQQEAMRRARDEAIAESRAKAQLLAELGHEIRTPLNAILGFADAIKTLNGDLPEEKKLEYIDAMTTSATALSRIVDDVLDKQGVRPDVSFSDEAVDVAGVLAKVAREYEGQLGKRIEVEPGDRQLRAKGDSVKLARILRNYISNAIKYAGSSSLIRLSHRSDDQGFVTIAVDDDGPGIPEGRESHVFQRYYRLHQHARIEGDGLGLAICRELADQMNGQVGIRRSASGGAQFWVRLPRGRSVDAHTLF